MGGYGRQRRASWETLVLFCEGGGEGKEMIQLHKWYPFVHPSPYDVRAIANEKRAEKLEYEYKLALEAAKIEKAVDALEIELYNKRSRQRTIELEIFNSTRYFDKYV